MSKYVALYPLKLGREVVPAGTVLELSDEDAIPFAEHESIELAPSEPVEGEAPAAADIVQKPSKRARKAKES